MKAFSSRSFKSLASRIHPPLPPSATQSNELLERLKKSYRHKLDQAHPSSTSLDNHLGRILSNPLLTAKVTQLATSPDTGNRFTKGLSNWFTNHVRRGAATPEIAEEYLNKILSRLGGHYATTPIILKNALKESQAGSRVLEYLWSQGLDTLEVLSKHTSLKDSLVKCLIAEERHDVLEHWIFDAQDTHLPLPRTLKQRMLLGGIESERYFGRSSSNFLRRVKREFEMLSRSNLPLAETQNLFGSTGKLLVHYLIFSERDSTRGQIAQEFWQVLLMSVSKWDQFSGWYRALLEFYCPGTPDLSDAVAFIKQKNSDPSSNTQLWRPTAVEFCLDCFELLFQRHKYDECEQVLIRIRFNGVDWLSAPKIESYLPVKTKARMRTSRNQIFLRQQHRYAECQKALDIAKKNRGKDIQEYDRIGQRTSGSEQDGRSDQSAPGREKLNLNLLNDLSLE